MIYFVGVSFWCASVVKDVILFHIHFFLNVSMGIDLGTFLVLVFRPWQEVLAAQLWKFTGASELPKPLRLTVILHPPFSKQPMVFARKLQSAVSMFSWLKSARHSLGPVCFFLTQMLIPQQDLWLLVVFPIHLNLGVFRAILPLSFIANVAYGYLAVWSSCSIFMWGLGHPEILCCHCHHLPRILQAKSVNRSVFYVLYTPNVKVYMWYSLYISHSEVNFRVTDA